MIELGGPGYETDSTLSSLVQIIIDPYYRTLEGFAVLLDREWIHFRSFFSLPFLHVCVFLN